MARYGLARTRTAIARYDLTRDALDRAKARGAAPDELAALALCVDRAEQHVGHCYILDRADSVFFTSVSAA